MEYEINWGGWCSFPGLLGDDEQHKIDALRLLQQVPAIVSVSLLDQTGTERVFVSRLRLNRTGRGIDMSADPAVLGARANRVWYGPVQYHQDSEPYMRIAVAGSLPAAGIAIAEVNLKLIWDVIAAIRIGETGYAIVVDDSGHLIAHPDISLVLRGRASSGSFGRIKHLAWGHEWSGGDNRGPWQTRRGAIRSCGRCGLDGNCDAAGPGSLCINSRSFVALPNSHCARHSHRAGARLLARAQDVWSDQAIGRRR